MDTRKKKFRNRRICAAIIAIALVVLAIAGAWKTVTFLEGRLTAPTFNCIAGKVVMDENHHNLYSAASELCKGNLTDAAEWIRKTNGIKASDLGNLYIGQVIIVQEGEK